MEPAVWAFLVLLMNLQLCYMDTPSKKKLVSDVKGK